MPRPQTVSLMSFHEYCVPISSLYRVAQKERNTYDQRFKENKGQNKQAVSIITYKILFPARLHQDH